MSLSNRSVSATLGILVVLAGCSSDSTNGGGNAADASLGSDATSEDAGGGTDATSPNDDASPDDGGPGTTPDAGDAAVSPGDAGPGTAGDSGTDGGHADPSLVLYYPFENGSGTVVSDVSGRAHDGTIQNGSDAGVSPWTASGRTGGAASFSGAQDVLVPTGVLTSVSDMTVGVWVKLNTVAAWSRVFDFGNGPLGTGDHWTFLTPSGISGVEWDLYGGPPGDAGSREAVVLSGTQLPTSAWKHIALTASGANYRMYIDGFPAAEVTGGPIVVPSSIEPLSPASWIGKSRFPDPALDGTVDELRIYNRVLSPTEVANLAWPQHDYSDWRFDEGAGTTAADSSDNAVAGTLSGGAKWTASGRLGAAVDLPGGVWADAGTGGPQVALADNPLKHCSSAFTVASWVKLHALTHWSRIFDFGTAKTSFVYLTPVGVNGLHFGMASPSGAPFDLEASTPLPGDNAWHHAAVTVDGADRVALYLDGDLLTSGSPVTDSGSYVKPADFAALTDNALGKSRFQDPYLDGSIDELRVSCRAFTADEIKALAHGP